MIQLGLAILNNQPISNVIEMAVAAEESGFDQVWIPDGSPAPEFRDPIVSLTAVAMQTKTIGLGTQILVPYIIHPLRMGVIASGIVELTGRPFNLGIGVGGSLTLKPLGLKMWDRPLQTIRETFSILRGFLSKDQVNFSGEIFKAVKAELAPKSPAPIKVFLGAQGPKMLQLSGQIADGVLLTAPLPYLPTAINHLKEGAESVGRRLEDLTICNYMATNVHSPNDAGNEEALRNTITFLVADTSDKVHQICGFSLDDVHRIRNAYENRDPNASRFLMDELLQAFAIDSTSDECWKQIQKQEEYGVTHLTVGAPYGKHPPTAIRLLASHRSK